jgi:hypothetical protein
LDFISPSHACVLTVSTDIIHCWYLYVVLEKLYISVCFNVL